MHYSNRIAALFLIAFLLLLSPALLADDDDRYILRPAPGALSRVLARYQLRLLKSYPQQNLYLVQATDDDGFADRAKSDRDVLAIELDEDLYAPEIPSGSTNPTLDPLSEALARRGTVNFFGNRVWEGFAHQPASSWIGLPLPPSRTALGAGVVAVIDTGVDVNHPALRGALVSGYDFTRELAGFPNDLADVPSSTAAALSQSTTAFIDNSARPVPINQYVVAALAQSTTAFIDTGKLPTGFGHGTMVASLVRLVAPSARIMPIKAFLADGSSSTFDILRSIYFAADRKVNVINMSFSMKASSPELVRAINYASVRGVVLVASAGNDGNEIIVYPAAYGNVIGVASVTGTGDRSGFSNYGSALVSLAAPGEGVIAAYPGNNYASVWGTSFSTPLVAGAAALLLQKHPGSTTRFLESVLLDSAIPAEPELGAGRLDVSRW